MHFWLHCSVLCNYYNRIYVMGVIMELEELKSVVLKTHCDTLDSITDVWQTISGLLDLIEAQREEIKSLRTDVDKLIENNGGSRYNKSA